MKITVITCYDQNDYVRARSLRAAIRACPGVETTILRNSNNGLLRYLEVPLKILFDKVKNRPDAYLITFRGYEMLPFVLLIKGRKPLIFDEFLNPAEYLVEHGKFKLDSRLGKIFIAWYASLLRMCRFVLSDTQVHAEYSAALCNLPLNKFIVLPVNADEKIFHPMQKKESSHDTFEIFYYGNGMTPLHGLNYILDAAVQLRSKRDIHFTIVGGKKKAEIACDEAVAQGGHVTYKSWIPFEDISVLAAQANLCLGGPFGKTLQSQMVVTGKTYQFLAVGSPVLIGENKATEQFKDKENCLLVPQADTQALVDAIEWSYKHPKELTHIGFQGRRLYEEHFSQRIVNKTVRDLIGEIN